MRSIALIESPISTCYVFAPLTQSPGERRKFTSAHQALHFGLENVKASSAIWTRVPYGAAVSYAGLVSCSSS